MASQSRAKVKVPSLLQTESAECGAACLGMVLAHYNRFVPLDELRIATGVSRDGATTDNTLQAARSYDLQAREQFCEPSDLRTMAEQLPLIVNWRFTHFVVVSGWSRRGWEISDPGVGQYTCDHDEFDRSFTGVTLTLTPGPAFQTGGQRPSTLRRVVNAAGRIGPVAAAAAVIAVLLLVPMMLVPQMLQLYGNELSGLVGLAAAGAVIGLLLALAIQSLLLSLQGVLSIRLATKVSLRVQATVVQRLLDLPASFHAQRGATAIAQRALLIDTLSEGMSSLTITVTTGLLTALVAEIALFLVDVTTGVVALIVVAIIALRMRSTIKVWRELAAGLVVGTVEVGTVATSALTQIESIKAAGSEDGIIARGIAAQNRLLAAQQSAGVRQLGLNMVLTASRGIGLIVIAGVAMLQISRGYLDPGVLLAVLALAGVLLAPVGAIVIALDNAQMLRATLDQVDDILVTDTEPEWPAQSQTEAPGTLIGALQLTDVTFGYSRLGDPVIHDFSVTITPGARVALVGPSGCGKSTISRMILGLYHPWSGELLIDGRRRSDHAPEVLADSLAMVSQDVVIFSASIRDNITLWDPTISDSDILTAIADAQLTDIVADRRDGLDAMLAEGGADLSGGQRQRLEIARALARNPVILVLDEATSALDPTTERLIDAAIRRRGTTCLVVAHRLSTIRDSDEIVVLDQGRVVERGTHEALMARSGTYADLVSTE